MNRMGKKSNKKLNKGVRGIFLILGIIVILGICLMFNMKNTHKNIEQWDKYAIIGKENIFVIYDGKLTVKIPETIQVDKDKTFEDLVDTKNYEEVLEALNRLLPVKVNNYAVIKHGSLDPKTKNYVNMPETLLDGKKYILTSSMHNMFDVLYNGQDKNNSKDLVVDILNANGKPGYAKKTGERLEKEFGLKYNAANYENNSDISYVVVNEINKDKLEEIIMGVDEKYFRIKKAGTVPTLANTVLILGTENSGVPVTIIGNSSKSSNLYNDLRKDGYKNLHYSKKNGDVDEPIIEYNKEDYYIAYKIGKKLNINKMVEKNDLNNKIVILSN